MSGHRQPLRCLHHQPHSSPQLSRCSDVCSHLALRVARLQAELSKPRPEGTSTPPAHVNRVVWEPAGTQEDPRPSCPRPQPCPQKHILQTLAPPQIFCTTPPCGGSFGTRMRPLLTPYSYHYFW
ncbi:PREDICTED: uncharacterized protein LOC108538013 [Rhinopithecus bieti]|uniref:uncharacterized protein LOC108538013 n=1 Tax=Rhinopithecus bieti TaxID=61621 RepID=UPI00083BD183|nr:PREDICTED: uncharacterized protein LOC108538013 [Rhinopithecus bieti]